jgi:glycosyltransferase involved in cell wall biosynthesis
VAPADPEALAAAVRSLIEHPAEAAAMGAAARATVLQQYSFDRMIASFEDLYLSSLQARLGARTEQAQTAGI